MLCSFLNQRSWRSWSKRIWKNYKKSLISQEIGVAQETLETSIDATPFGAAFQTFAYHTYHGSMDRWTDKETIAAGSPKFSDAVSLVLLLPALLPGKGPPNSNDEEERTTEREKRTNKLLKYTRTYPWDAFKRHYCVLCTYCSEREWHFWRSGISMYHACPCSPTACHTGTLHRTLQYCTGTVRRVLSLQNVLVLNSDLGHRPSYPIYLLFEQTYTVVTWEVAPSGLVWCVWISL